MVQESESIVLVTAIHPALDAAIEIGLRNQGISGWKTARIGPYVVYYKLPGNVTPAWLGFGTDSD